MIAPVIPVVMTKTAVRDGDPPMASDTPSATGAVADFGMSASNMSASSPSATPIPTALSMAASDPATKAAIMGSAAFLMWFRFA